MPKLISATPKYRLHKASGQAIVTISGKDHYLGPHGTKASKIEYDRLVGLWLAAGRPAAPPAPKHEVTVTEVIAAFWKYAKGHFVKNGRATGTAENYKPILSWLKQRYGHTLAAEFGPLDLKAVRGRLIEENHSRRYINEQIDRLKIMFKWAASEQLIPSDVPAALATVKGLEKGRTAARETAPITPVEDTVVERTLPHLPKVVADMVRIQRLTGARPGEICSMRRADIDRSGEVWHYVPLEHKTEHHNIRRTIYIGPKAQMVLRPYLLRDTEGYCFVPAESEKRRRKEMHQLRETPLSCGNVPGSNRKRRRRRPPGKCYTNDTYRRAIARGCELAFGMPEHLRKIPDDASEERKAAMQKEAAAWREANVWSPNQLRHTAATEIRSRFGLEAAQVTLGHARMDVTQVYAEKNQALATHVALAVG